MKRYKLKDIWKAVFKLSKRNWGVELHRPSQKYFKEAKILKTNLLPLNQKFEKNWELVKDLGGFNTPNQPSNLNTFGRNNRICSNVKSTC